MAKDSDINDIKTSQGCETGSGRKENQDASAARQQKMGFSFGTPRRVLSTVRRHCSNASERSMASEPRT